MDDLHIVEECVEFTRQDWDKAMSIFKGSRFASLITYGLHAPKRYLEAKIRRQSDIIKIMAVLPGGKYRYDAIDAAVNAAGVRPEDIYMGLAAGESTMALARFYEALTGEER